MSYEIRYGFDGEARKIAPLCKYLQRIGIFLLIIAMLGGFIWCAGGDWEVTIGALEQMAEDLEQGSGLTDAISAFCVEIFQGAQG